tara:strand:+ start:517 stop:771 length:255 start_codon:yes stop_codon:yes gene_type:complete
MTNSQIGRVLNKIKKENKLSETNIFYKATLGFRRLSCLPKKVRFAFDLASNIEMKWDGSKALKKQLTFLESLTEQEYINWLKVA